MGNIRGEGISRFRVPGCWFGVWACRGELPSAHGSGCRLRFRVNDKGFRV